MMPWNLELGNSIKVELKLRINNGKVMLSPCNLISGVSVCQRLLEEEDSAVLGSFRERF